ncbi:hypothetical protein RHMOL_Rhmol01G0053600 [Rhododendron molle]|uniref:Uncharacterized protein n=1 Tax=Rhododendron molle TaxID=49168 RepID=A0ACC0PZT0_RHOML|nr:hypothetical protein RHMOL_Rhmol01G0053600 [Rhododendron molle]
MSKRPPRKLNLPLQWGSKKQRSDNFTVEEDKLLMSAWLNISMDAIQEWWSMFHFCVGIRFRTLLPCLREWLHTVWRLTEGEQVIAAFAVRGADNRMVYQPFDEFVQDYQGVFNLGHVSEWNYGFQLNAWLDDLVYHSFVRYSEEVVDQCWYLKKVSMPGATEAFNEFAAALFVQFLNDVMVVMLPSVEFWVIVFDGRYESERLAIPGFRLVVVQLLHWLLVS